MIPYRVTAQEVCGTIPPRCWILENYAQGCANVCKHCQGCCHGEVEFDFEGGPEGAEHVHPESVFHGDCRKNPLPEFDHH